MFSFLVDGGVAAVDIFRVVIFGQNRQNTPSKSDNLPGKAGNGEHEPVAETVVNSAAGAARQKTAIHRDFIPESASVQSITQGLPFVQAPAQLEFFHNFIAQAALLNVFPAQTSRRSGEIAHKVCGGQLVDSQHITLA